MADNILVEIEQGKLKGNTASDYHGGQFYKFMGIPYAKAPLDELRFKAPQPPEPWNDIRDATKEGPECPSTDMFFKYYVGNEDNCLNLNVYTKELPKDNNPIAKPVMVWIHGGAFICGSNKPDLYGPDYLMTQDIVLVTINYRLGILGFLSFKDPSLGVPGNAGLKDMRMALKWVQKNINTFGGNPNNVTIFGESAGAASVSYLTLSPSTKGLFHKVIQQSGCALNSWAWGKNNAAETAKYMGYKESDEKAILAKLRRESARNLVNGQSKHKEDFLAANIRPWGPVVEPPSEDAFLTETPTQLMRSGGGHKVPMIIGYNSGEGIFFELVRKTYPGIGLPKNYELELPFELGLEPGTEKCKEMSEKVKRAYFEDKECNEEDIEKYYLLKGDTNFIYSIQRAIKLQTKHSSQPVYTYRMSLVSSLNFFNTLALSKYFKTAIFWSFLSKMSTGYLSSMQKYMQSMITRLPKKEFDGVVHADDLPYLFPAFFSQTIKQGSTEDLYIQRFVKLWTNFAKSGEPTPQTDETLNNVIWKPFTLENMDFLDIGKELKMIPNVDADRLKFWDEIYESYFKI